MIRLDFKDAWGPKLPLIKEKYWRSRRVDTFPLAVHDQLLVTARGVFCLWWRCNMSQRKRLTNDQTFDVCCVRLCSSVAERLNSPDLWSVISNDPTLLYYITTGGKWWSTNTLLLHFSRCWLQVSGLYSSICLINTNIRTFSSSQLPNRLVSLVWCIWGHHAAFHNITGLI